MKKHTTEIEERREVLVVDDDPALLHSLKFALELEGYAVSTFHDGAEILALGSVPKRAFLIVDEALPDMSGLDVLGELRARGTTAPAVLITTAPGEALVRRAEAGGVRIIEKPLLGNTLSRAIDAAFDGGD